MATETLTNDATNWPSIGNPPPAMNSISPTDPNPGWEMIAEDEENNTTHNNANVVDDHVFILPERDAGLIKGRPRSATIGGDAVKSIPRSPSGNSNMLPKSTSSMSSNSRRVIRRCASTPDLLIGDKGHEVIVEDESDEESDEVNMDLIKTSEEGVERELTESFELLSDKSQEESAAADEEDDEPVMIEEDTTTGEEESATLISTPSMGTSSWTMASAAPTAATHPPAAWGMKKSPSFAEMLAKNIDADSANAGVFGKDKAATEAKLRDSHRRHHLRVRTKPKFVISETDSTSKGGKMMAHAHSTGDLTKMLTAVEEGHESSRGQGGRNRRAMNKQLSAMEEEDEGDFIIGRGSGGGSGGGGGGEVMGDTDAMDYYSRKDHGSRSTSNKKKERPDEAKRREIIMHKKDMQRKKQAAQKEGSSGNSEAAAGGKKKKKNDKGFGGKKERRRM